MLRAASHLKGASIAATDGEIGSVHDLYFDDLTWTIRYLVVDTGTWLPGRQVLISPRSVKSVPDPDRVPVALTKAQVKESPSIDAEKPVERQYEETYSQYYGYPYYWTGPYRWGTTPYPGEGPLSEARATSVRPPPDAHPSLRSVRHVTGYYVEAIDGDIGHVEDFLVDDVEWAIRYMVVDTRNWWPGGKKVIVSPDWINRVSWPDSRVYVDMSREGVKTAPEYDADRPLEREYEARLFGHHKRPTYWDEGHDAREGR